MAYRRKKSIRTRFFLQIFIPVLILYSLFIAGGARYIGESFKENTLHQKRVALSMVVQGIDDWFLSRVSEVVQLSWIPLFRTADEDAIRTYLANWRETLSFRYNEVLLIERDGSYWSSAGASGEFPELSYLDLFFKEGALFTYGGPRRYGSVLQDYFIIGAPITYNDGTTGRILTATISLETLHRVFSFFTFEDFDSWMVVNPRSIIVIHDDYAMTGLSERGEYGTTFLENEEWNDRYVFVKPMRSGWKLVTFIDKQRVVRLYRQVFSLVVWFSIILFVITAGLVLILSSTVSRPIIRLTKGVNKIMAGDYGARITIRTGDELSALAESFNRLASRMTSLRTEDRFVFLGHIAARMAHELRKPLHIIRLASQSLEGDSERRERNIGIINEEITNADRFISQILDFAHTEALEKSEYSVTKLLKTVIGKYRLIADDCGITISFVERTAVPNVYIDVMRMEEVFSNVLQNAVEAVCGCGLNPKEICVEQYLSGNMEIEIVIRDSGPGFDEEHIDKMFDPYFTTKDTGTGLGLSLCYRILMAHGAGIELGNDEDHHGLVKILFPI